MVRPIRRRNRHHRTSRRNACCRGCPTRSPWRCQCTRTRRIQDMRSSPASLWACRMPWPWRVQWPTARPTTATPCPFISTACRSGAPFSSNHESLHTSRVTAIGSAKLQRDQRKPTIQLNIKRIDPTQDSDGKRKKSANNAFHPSFHMTMQVRNRSRAHSAMLSSHRSCPNGRSKTMVSRRRRPISAGRWIASWQCWASLTGASSCGIRQPQPTFVRTRSIFSAAARG